MRADEDVLERHAERIKYRKKLKVCAVLEEVVLMRVRLTKEEHTNVSELKKRTCLIPTHQ